MSGFASGGGGGGGTDLVARMGVLANAFDRLMDHGLAVQGYGSWMIDEFEDETGVDTTDSTDETYNSGSDYYENPQGYLADDIPDMVSASSPSGTASASTSEPAPEEAWNAMDDDTGTQWQATAGTGWLQYEFATAINITRMKITTGGSVTLKPDDWTLEASNTGAFGGEEVVLDTVVNAGLSVSTEYTYDFTNGTAYTHYRMVITDVETGSGGIQLKEFQLFELKSAPDMVLISEPQTAGSSPANGQAIFLVDAIDAFTLNTDLKGYLSSDDGVTWDEITLENYGDHGTGIAVLGGEVALTGAGTEIRWKLAMFNNKEVNVHGVGAMWD